jgi:hypothetical protein
MKVDPRPLPFGIDGPYRKTRRPVRHGRLRVLWNDLLRFLLAPSPF